MDLKSAYRSASQPNGSDLAKAALGAARPAPVYGAGPAPRNPARDAQMQSFQKIGAPSPAPSPATPVDGMRAAQMQSFQKIGAPQPAIPQQPAVAKPTAGTVPPAFNATAGRNQVRPSAMMPPQGPPAAMPGWLQAQMASNAPITGGAQQPTMAPTAGRAPQPDMMQRLMQQFGRR